MKAQHRTQPSTRRLWAIMLATVAAAWVLLFAGACMYLRILWWFA